MSSCLELRNPREVDPTCLIVLGAEGDGGMENEYKGDITRGRWMVGPGHLKTASCHIETPCKILHLALAK